MTKQEILRKLNQNNNFHLSLKVIQITDEEYLKELAKKLQTTYIIIDSLEGCYDKLLKAYISKIDFVLINEQIDFLLPLAVAITKDKTKIIKPAIPVLYHLKDNRIIQKVKTTCHKKMTIFESFKCKEEMIERIISLIK